MTFGQTANTEESGGNKPVHTEKVGGITVSTWENTGKNGKYFTMNMQRCYKDGEEFKYTGNMRLNDIPKLILAWQETYKKAVVADNSE